MTHVSGIDSSAFVALRWRPQLFSAGLDQHPPPVEQYELAVEGMACSGCAERVTNAAKQVDGVHRAEADHEAGRLAVTAEAGIQEAVRQAIHDAGYGVPA